MYSVIVYASWDALAKGRIRLEGTFRQRGAAMEAADACAYPIVDVRDIGEAGRCPARPHLPEGEMHVPQGHRLVCTPETGNEWECRDCRARHEDLYEGTTYMPKPPTDALVDGPYYALANRTDLCHDGNVVGTCWCDA